MKRILFPTDLSEETRPALDYAVYIAREIKAQLILVNAFDLKYLHPDLPAGSYDMEEERSHRMLDELRQDIRSDERNKDLNITVFAAYGSTIRTLEEVAEQENVDMVVMGTKGVSAVKDFFTDSMTYQFIERSHRPVLVIPDKEEFRSVRKILFATDLISLPQEKVEVVKALAKGIGAEVKLVNVSRGSENASREKAEQDVAELAKRFGDDVEHSSDIIEGKEVLQALEEYIDQDPEVGMLAMIAHERRDWLERFTSPRLSKKVAHHPFLPTLIVKY